MDPMSNFGPGGLGNEVHLGGTSPSMFPSPANAWESPSQAGTWPGAGAYYRPSLTSRIGGRIFGSSWSKIAQTTSWLLRLSCAGAGFWCGGHFAGKWLADVNDTKLLVASCLGAVLGFVAPIVLRAAIPLIVLFGAIYVLVWLFIGNPFP